MAFAKPEDIVRIRRRFNQNKKDKNGNIIEVGKYLPTDPNIFRFRKLKEEDVKEALGYFSINNISDSHFKEVYELNQQLKLKL